MNLNSENKNERTLEIKGEGMARGQEVKIKELPMNKIKLARNCRLGQSKEDLSGLMQSINSVGLLEPIGVIQNDGGKESYEICYGNRRFMAFSKLGLHSIPAVIHKRRNKNDADVKNLAENVQRRNISMAEVGRFATILEGEGLGIKELAIRLGAPVNYVENAIRAYREVPEEFREDLEMQTTGKKVEPGKISIQNARAIINAKKTLNLPKKETNVLFRAAKNDSRFQAADVYKYAAAIKQEKKDPIAVSKATKACNFKFLIEQSEYDRLVEKYVANGPFRSFSDLLKAICRGQKQVVINFIG